MIRKRKKRNHPKLYKWEMTREVSKISLKVLEEKKNGQEMGIGEGEHER